MQADERYAFLASAVAGRRTAVRFSSSDEPLAYSDGQSIVLPSTATRGDAETAAEVCVQAALIAAGSLNAEAMRQLIGRPQIARRYLYLEALRASRVAADRLPLWFSKREELVAAELLTRSAAASLLIASGRQPLPTAPAWFGTIQPFMSLRRAVTEEGFSALTRRQQEGDIEKSDADDLGDDAGEESKLLKLFQNPIAGKNPLAEILKNLLGAGVSRKKDTSSDSGGGDEIPVGRIERALRRGVNAVLAKLRRATRSRGSRSRSRCSTRP